MSCKHVAAAWLTVGALAVGCGAQPKQVQPPMFEDSQDQDISVDEPKEIEPAAKMPEEMTAAEKKQSCCEQCAKGLAKDRTGQPAEQIPCTDFTADLEEDCLKYFRKKPVQASECKSLVAEAGAGNADGPGADPGDAGAAPPVPPAPGG